MRRGPAAAVLYPFGRTRRGPPEPEYRACAVPGCQGKGEHKAPRDRSLKDYIWLCLDHVREHNSAWNYYAGMTPDEMEAEIRKSQLGDRPTWKLGTLGGRGRERVWRDPFGVFGEEGPQPERRRRRPGPETVEERAVRILDLQVPFTIADLKAKYKALVKIHHPDVNYGDPAAVERIKDINEAYNTLLALLNP